MLRSNYQKLLLLFFLSGVTSLAYETIFVKLLGYVFGNTTYAVSTILAAFMGGLAGGSYLFGRYIERKGDGLRLYAYLECGVGLYCIFVPLLFRAIEPIYVLLFQKFSLSLIQLTALRFLLSSILVLPPTLLMGGTFPVLAKYLVTEAAQIGKRISALYAANTYGAACGVFFVTYFLLGMVGIYGTIILAVAGNLLICFIALKLARSRANAESLANQTEVSVANNQESRGEKNDGIFLQITRLLGFDWQKEAAASHNNIDEAKRARWLYLFAFVSGILSFAYEIVWTHVLHQTVGTSAYAFGIMLTTMLLGIAVGSHLVGKVFDNNSSPECQLVLTQILLGLSIFLLLPLWPKIPKLFKITQLFRPDFQLFEATRFIACFMVMFIPALLLGISLPLLIKVRARQLPQMAEQLGTIYFFNTLGCIIGSTLTGFFLLSRLGSELTMRVAASINILVGILLASALLSWQEKFRMRLSALALLSCIAGIFLLPHWDLNELNSGAHLYGVEAYKGDILYYNEDIHGGVVSVIQTGDTRTLLANAKFMGNDTGEMAAQRGFAIAPLVFAHNYNNALIIGLGTGVTASTVASFPFSQIDIAEISPGIVEAAKTFFDHVNRNLLDDARVKVHVTDGRNFVLLTPNKYDVITVELNNVWFAGATNLYSKNFYDLCRARLNSGGVMQQWIQIHHIDPLDLISVIKTMHESFPHMAFFILGEQGIMVGSDQPLSVDYQKLSLLNQTPAINQMAREAELLNGDLLSILNGIYLYEDNLTNFANSDKFAYINTDWNLQLEYTTPKGNQMPYAFLTNYSLINARRFNDLPQIINASQDKLFYIAGLRAVKKGDLYAAANLLQKSLDQGNNDEKCRSLLEVVQKELKVRSAGL
jgi:spermidine synthase